MGEIIDIKQQTSSRHLWTDIQKQSEKLSNDVARQGDRHTPDVQKQGDRHTPEDLTSTGGSSLTVGTIGTDTLFVLLSTAVLVTFFPGDALLPWC
jgi:hypothetical protein